MAAMAARIDQCSPSDEERYIGLLEEAFDLFDVDNSGYLEPREVVLETLQRLLPSTYHKVPNTY